MKTNENKNQSCGCGCDFKKEIDNLVNEGRKPTHREHLQREKEIDAAFGTTSLGATTFGASSVRRNDRDRDNRRDSTRDSYSESGVGNSFRDRGDSLNEPHDSHREGGDSYRDIRDAADIRDFNRNREVRDSYSNPNSSRNENKDDYYRDSHNSYDDNRGTTRKDSVTEYSYDLRRDDARRTESGCNDSFCTNPLHNHNK